MSVQIAFSIIKTCLGGWLTNRRIQSLHRPCIFCGREQDSLQHLWQCDRLWHTISLAFSPFLPFIDDPPSLLGLFPLSCKQLYGVHIAYMTYHTLRIHDNVSNHLLFKTVQAQVSKCKIAKHFLAAHFWQGSITLLRLLSQPSPPLWGHSDTHSYHWGPAPFS